MRNRMLRRFRELVLVLAILALAACVRMSVFEIWDEVVNGVLTISPSFASLQAGQTVTLRASGGTPGYGFELVGGGGSLVEIQDGQAQYTAPGGDTTAAIRLTDAAGTESDASVLVMTLTPLVIHPSIASLPRGGTQAFVASGGLSPLDFSLVSGLGSVSAAGVYTAPATEDTDAVVRVEDAAGQSMDVTVTVKSAPQPLVIDPTTLTIETNSTFTFSASGGTSPYTFSAVLGQGGFTPGTGIYTAPGSAGGPYTITVVDNVAASASAVVMVMAHAAAPLQIMPTTATVKLGSTFQFQAEGGDGSYTFTMQVPPIGSITPDGLYSAPPVGDKTGNGKVLLTDGRGIKVTGTVKVKK